jgi:nucleotide-binding universal stress UspA family protein
MGPETREIAMFKHILVPTDGSNLSHTAALNAVEIAKATGAHITAFHVAPAYKFDLHDDQVPHGYMLPVDYEERMAQTAQHHLDDVKKLAVGSRRRIATASMRLSDYPAAAIVKAVEKYGCDAIVMGSHGRTGINKLLLGSETQKVLRLDQSPGRRHALNSR